MNSSVSSDWQNSCSTIQDTNLKLLSSKKFSDVVFLVGETKVEVPAHKLILMSRSSVFETMFERWETEKNSQVEIPEITHKSFQLFLRYLYSNTFSVTGTDAAEVLYLAHKYDTKGLAKLCSDLLKSGINTSNVVHIHQIASKLDQGELKAQAMSFILKNGKAVFADAGFFKIDFETLATILRDDKLAVDELTVFRAVIRWAENKCNVQKLSCTGQNKRAVLKGIVHLIRFPIMRIQDFTDEVIGKNKGILTDSETIGIYMHFTTGGVTNTPLPALPFNKNKRATGDIYKVDIYEGVGHCLSQQYSCRHGGSGTNYQCESTIIFQSSRNICVNAIDLLNNYSTTVGSQLVNSISVSVSPTEVGFGLQQLQAQLHRQHLLTTSSTKIEFENAVEVLSNTRYSIKISCTGGGGRQSLLRHNHPAQPTKSVNVSCGSENVTLSFVSETIQCGSPYRSGYYSTDPYQNCVCSGQLKTIHFTI